ncbi:MAG: helix-turn-helix domain-containing protein [Burkholderiales bacterium]|nr:helix-turn-helix domain-containing protein [Burkholderiales bacterium]
MDALDIIYHLRRLGKTQAALADELAVSHSTINNVIHNRTTCHGVATHIATLLSIPVEELWPGRYEFKPRSQVRRRAPSSPTAATPIQKLKEDRMT